MDDQKESAQGSSISPESEGLILPPGLELLEKLGKGSMCTVYKAHYQGETVALKVYSDKAVKWYRDKHSSNIAVIEMAQNRAFRKVPALLPYTAKPIRVLGQDGRHTLCFLQEFVDGFTVEDLGAHLGTLPEGLIQVGQVIAQSCEDEGLEGIEQFMQNTKVREKAGQWFPVIHDFKHIPTETGKKKSGPSLLSRLGLGGKNRREARFVSDWRARAAKLRKASG